MLPRRPPACLVGVAQRRCLSSAPKSSKDESLFDSAYGWMQSLRTKAAEALTTSLPPEDRQRLLRRLDPGKDDGDKEDRSHQHHHSIAEAIAASKAYEQALIDINTSKEKKLETTTTPSAKLTEIQQQQLQAAEERVNTELKMIATAESSLQNNDDVHPILGPALIDLGYKRIHCVSAETLSSIQVWKKQRTYRHDRAKAMAKDKKKTLSLGIPGVINVYESKDGTLSIIDGQHRIGMMSVLQEEKAGIDLDRILVEVFTSPDQTEDDSETQQALFSEVNKAEPVKLIDLVATTSRKKVIDGAAMKLQERFGPEMFKPSQRCRPPHVNVDNLRDALHAAEIAGTFTTVSKLYGWMIEQNERLQKEYETDEKKAKSVSEAVLKKAKKHGFFLGLDSTWMYNR